MTPRAWFKNNRSWAVPVIIGIVSELLPLPGALAAALVFPEGIHSSNPTAYFYLSFALNFLIVAGSSYLWYRIGCVFEAQTFCNFHFPRRNNTIDTAASADSAIGTASNTPVVFIPIGNARKYASGI